MLDLVWLIPAFPLLGFLVLVVGGRKPGEPRAGWLATGEARSARLPAAMLALPRLYRESDILVDASFHEGFGLVPLEAMMSGCVVVSSDSGGVNEFLVDGENGTIIREVNKPERYVEAVLGLANNRQQLERLRANALARASELDGARAYRGYLEYFSRLLSA